MTDTFARMRQLIGTTAEWAANDLIIGSGEFALERVGGAIRAKVGNGTDKFSVLPYFDPGLSEFVMLDGDTMTGPLIVPELTVQGPATVTGGVTVGAGNSSFGGPVNLGAAATATSPASLADDSTKVPTTHWVQQQVGGIISGLNIKGAWNAATNTPALASGGAGVPTPERGDFYIVSVAGSTNLDGITTWAVGDTVVFNGVSWQRVPQTLGFDQIVSGLGYTPADDAEVIHGDLIDAAGDLLVGSGPDAVARLPKGATGDHLTATAGGLAWATPGTGEFVAFLSSGNIALNSGGVVLTGMPVTFGNAGSWYTPGTGRYVPPAGRYRLDGAGYVFNSGGTASACTLVVRKNGVMVTRMVGTALASVAIPVSAATIVDANGTDYFDLHATCGASVPTFSDVTFQAHPLR